MEIDCRFAMFSGLGSANIIYQNKIDRQKLGLYATSRSCNRENVRVLGVRACDMVSQVRYGIWLVFYDRFFGKYNFTRRPRNAHNEYEARRERPRVFFWLFPMFVNCDDIS